MHGAYTPDLLPRAVPSQEQGVKSKRFMKQMLLHMKKARHIRTLKEKGATHFGYIMPEKIPPPPPLPPAVALKKVKERFVSADAKPAASKAAQAAAA
jgi:hypothetical protein